MAFDYATVLVLGAFEDVCRVVVSLDQEAVAVPVREGLVALIPGRGDFFGDEIGEELSRLMGFGALGWYVDDEEQIAGTVYEWGEELHEYVSHPLLMIDPEVLRRFGTDRFDPVALRVALAGGAPSGDVRTQHALIMAAMGFDPTPFISTVEQALAADLPGARYLAASDYTP